MTKKKVFGIIAAIAIPTAYAAIAYKFVKGATKTSENHVVPSPEAEVVAESDTDKDTYTCVNNVCKWWTKTGASNELHDVSFRTTEPMKPEDFKAFQDLCRRHSTARDAVREATRFMYDRGYVITYTYTYDSDH